MTYRLGIDVGGTNTDAVILDQANKPVAKAKTPTTPEVTAGILQVLDRVLAEGQVDPAVIKYVMLGTTHCTNAVVERKRLCKVAVLRIGAPATLAIKPLVGWPEDLSNAIGNLRYVVGGGYEFDGRRIAPLEEEEIKWIFAEVIDEAESFAVTLVF